ncbi:hypothetical protein V5279_23900 [Bradyrhizobium sp. 26S5]|uniref:hypothetical protein n=1 Tax=Bradyrhizobium sp. 26S5 TaxID=3139729 RepID=UPI0030CD1E67
MSGLSEIENKIAALRARYAELDERLVPKRNGIIDGSVSAAMGVVTAEIARLEGLREKALVSDLIGETSTESPSPPPPQRPAAAALPEPVFATKNSELSDPLLGLERLPDAQHDRAQIYRKLAVWACEYVNSSLEQRKNDAGQDVQVQFTQGFFRALIITLGAMTAEYRYLIALGRDNRKILEETLLRRIEALEARPVMVDAGVFDDAKTYSPGSFVSYQGSGWAAQVETRGVRPGDGTIWRLAVKKRSRRKGCTAMTIGSEMSLPEMDPDHDVALHEHVARYRQSNPSEARLIEAIADGFAPVIREAIGNALQPLAERLADLERRVGKEEL